MNKTLFRTLSATLIMFNASLIYADDVLQVGVQPLSDLLINTKGSAPASIVSLNHSLISAEITGRVLNVYAEVGDQVEKGKQLVSLDCRSYALSKKQALAAVRVAKTQLNYSNKQFKRNDRLVSQGTISREIFERTEANRLTAAADLELKQASVETTDLTIGRCKIYAPFSGQITERFAQKGQLVSSGTALYKLIQSDNIEVKADLSSNDVAKINDYRQLNFVSPDIKLKTAVRSIIGIIDETTRTQEVRFSLQKNTLAPVGLSGRIEWNSKEQQLPSEYVLRRQDILGIFLAEDVVEGVGKAKFYPLLKANEGQPTKINLPKQSIVITKNRFRVKNGQQIKVVIDN